MTKCPVLRYSVLPVFGRTYWQYTGIPFSVFVYTGHFGIRYTCIPYSGKKSLYRITINIWTRYSSFRNTFIPEVQCTVIQIYRYSGSTPTIYRNNITVYCTTERAVNRNTGITYTESTVYSNTGILLLPVNRYTKIPRYRYRICLYRWKP